MDDMRATARMTGVGVVAAFAITLAGCGSSGQGRAKASPPTSPTAVAAAKAEGATKTAGSKPPPFLGVQHAIPSGKALDNSPAMYRYVLKTGCSSIPGGWQATGTAQNVTAEPLVFKVLVFFTDAQARIVDSTSTAIAVPAKTKGAWTASRQFRAPKGTQCVVRAVTKG